MIAVLQANEYLKEYNRNTHKVAKLYEGLGAGLRR